MKYFNQVEQLLKELLSFKCNEFLIYSDDYGQELANTFRKMKESHSNCTDGASIAFVFGSGTIIDKAKKELQEGYKLILCPSRLSSAAMTPYTSLHSGSNVQRNHVTRLYCKEFMNNSQRDLINEFFDSISFCIASLDFYSGIKEPDYSLYIALLKQSILCDTTEVSIISFQEDIQNYSENLAPGISDPVSGLEHKLARVLEKDYVNASHGNLVANSIVRLAPYYIEHIEITEISVLLQGLTDRIKGMFDECVISNNHVLDALSSRPERKSLLTSLTFNKEYQMYSELKLD